MNYLGTCITAFDDDGNGIEGNIYHTVTDFAQGEGDAVELRERDFFDKTNIHPSKLKNFIPEDSLQDLMYLYDEEKHVVMAYDIENDIHYLFALGQEDLVINRLKHELLDNIEGFQQFKDAPIGSFLIQFNGYNTLDLNKISVYVSLRPFEGMDYSKINCHSYGPFDFAEFKNVDGSVSFGSHEGVTIQFSTLVEPITPEVTKKPKALEI